jgi:CRISPR-associated protein Cmr4
MYIKRYGIIETLAPLHVGASAGEETGNLNLIFRDQFTQTGIIPGSSVRGRFRADMRGQKKDEEQHWYGHEVIPGQTDGGTTEALVKFEYASLVWLPVFCPGQPVVWVTCPWLLKRYQQIAKSIDPKVPKDLKDLPLPYTAPAGLGRQIEGQETRTLFFNLGFIELEHTADLAAWIPEGVTLNPKYLVVVDDNDMAMIHDMALYRQSRVKLLDDMKKVDTEKGAFFNVEALPEGSVMVFPVAMKQSGWQPFGEKSTEELYFGGLESIGFGHCRVTLSLEGK